MALVRIDLRPDRRRLREFGLVALVLFSLLAGLALWRGHLLGLELGDNARAVATGLAALAGFSGLAALWWPAANRPLYTLLSLVAWPIGLVVGHVVLALIYFGAMLPLGLVFRLIGRDALQGRPDPSRASYWVDREGGVDKGRYFRQF